MICTVDEKQDLDGKPDYLIAPYADNGVVATPLLCAAEAKEKEWKKERDTYHASLSMSLQPEFKQGQMP